MHNDWMNGSTAADDWSDSCNGDGVVFSGLMGEYGPDRLAERNAKNRENFDSMIAPLLAAQRPLSIPKRAQRQAKMKYFGRRGYYG